VKASHDGLSLWYATPDTPVPPDDGAPRSGLSVTVAAHPPSPSNRVGVTYRVDGGPQRMVSAYSQRTDFARRVQYFCANLPALPSGNVVEYAPHLSCGGRRVAAGTPQAPFPSQFTLAPVTAPAPVVLDSPTRSPSPSQRYAPYLEFLCAVTSQYSTHADVIGETPEGLRVNYYLDGGTVVGPRINGRALPGGGDSLAIRPDGVALVSVRATFETIDGALIGADIDGILDLGSDAQARAQRGDFPKIAALQLAPKLITADSRYLWLNRLQLLAVGQVRLEESTVAYDLFGVRTASPLTGAVE
jgi:hypothetical protein